MKKWILNIGLTTITVLPIVAVASCSSITTESPSLNSEVEKYKNPFTVKDSSKTMTPTAVARSINIGSSAQKLAALQTIVTLILDNTNFTYEVEQAKVGADNRVDVSVKITDKLDPTKNQTINLVINGFTTPTESGLDIEAKRFQTSILASEIGKTLKATEAVTQINGAAEGVQLSELGKLAAVPTPNSGFSIKVIIAKVASEATSIEVTIEVSETGTSNKVQVPFTITGFATLSATEILAAQAERLTNQIVLEDKQTETPLQASKAITSENIDSYYKKIELLDGITYTFKGATPNEKINTTLDVELIVKSNVEGVSEITKKVEITGFTSPQTLLDKQADLMVDQTALEAKATQTATSAVTAITSTEILKTYYKEIALSTGFSYELKTNGVSAIGDTVKVIVIVSSEDTNTTPVEKTFTITGFKKEVEVQAEKLKTAPAKNNSGTTRQIITGINETSETPEKKLIALKAIVTLPELSSGFTIKVGEASQGTTDTSVNVALTIEQDGTSNTASVTFVITGLTAEDAQAEIARLVKTNLVNKEVLEGKKGETAATALAAITDLQTLAPYYTLITLPKSLKYNYKSKLVDNNTVKVTLSISLQNGDSAQEKQVVISGFKTAALAALENEAKKLTNKTTLQANKTAMQAKAEIISDEKLNQYYAHTRLTARTYGYNYGGKSEVNEKDPKILNITLKVRQLRTNPELAIFIVVELSGFAEPTETEKEALKFETSLTTKTQGTTTNAVISAINADGASEETKLAALKGFVTDFPTEGQGYSLAIGTAVADTTTPTSVNIPITISPKQAEATTRNTTPTESPVKVIFTITDLTVETPAQVLARVSEEHLINKTITLSEGQKISALKAATLITDIATLNNYYPSITMPSGITYSFTGVAVNETDKTILDVTLEVSFEDKEDLDPVTKVVQLSGFLNADNVLKKVAEPLVTRETLIKNTTAAAAKEIIKTDKTLNLYYQNTKLTNGFSYHYGGKTEVDAKNPTTLNVTLRVTDNIGTTIFIVVPVTGFQSPTTS